MKKSMFAAVLLLTLAMTLIPVCAQSATKSTFVATTGKVESYGAKPACGWLGTFAEVGKWAEAGVIWTIEGPRILLLPGKYHFYAARLVNTTVVELNYTQDSKFYDFYISGLWDVWNITFAYNRWGNASRKTMQLMVNDGSGELKVTNNWTNFEVDIAGIEPIVGIVKCYRIKPYSIPRGDVTSDPTKGNFGIPDGKIDIWDLVHVAKAYGTTPGIGKYNLDIDISFSIDLNFDFAVDIFDLTTIAANLGQSY